MKIVSANPKDLQFTVIDERNQKMFTFKKMQSKNLLFFLKMYSNYLAINLFIDEID